MADEIDFAADRYEAWLENRVAEHQYQLNQSCYQPTGYCLNCDEKLDDGRRFCNAECREDFEHRNRRL